MGRWPFRLACETSAGAASAFCDRCEGGRDHDERTLASVRKAKAGMTGVVLEECQRERCRKKGERELRKERGVRERFSEQSAEPKRFSRKPTLSPSSWLHSSFHSSSWACQLYFSLRIALNLASPRREARPKKSSPTTARAPHLFAERRITLLRRRKGAALLQSRRI